MSEGDRRRHRRHAAPVQVVLALDGARLSGSVLDISAGGVWLELPDGVAPPPLGAKGRAVLEKDGAVVSRAARVVRVRLAGRDGGVPMKRACAWVFDDGDDQAEHRLARMLAS